MIHLILGVLAFLTLAVVGALGSVVVALTVLLQTVGFFTIASSLSSLHFNVGP